MNAELISLITVNRDAIATNRGFYYQYLNVVLKWVTNFLNDEPKDVYTEVDDDIKEVGQELVFTQVKCYSSTFSFNSLEIRKALLNFYSLYLKHHEQTELSFYFTSNTAPSRNEKLLQKWISTQPPREELLELCVTKVSTILLKEIKDIRDKRFGKEKLTQDAKQALTKVFTDLNNIVKNRVEIEDFVNRIRWDFAEQTPEESIKTLLMKITEELGNPKFGSRPVKLLIEAMLSEIYRRSQLSDAGERKVNNAGLKILLETKDEELKGYIDLRLINSLNIRFDFIESELNDVKGLIKGFAGVQEKYGKLLDQLVRDKEKPARQMPRLIMRLPYFNSVGVIGRNNKLTEIQNVLSVDRHVSLYGVGGMGKSTMIQYFLQTNQHDFDHIIWIDADAGFVDSISLNQQIADALNFPVDMENYAGRFSQILAKLNEIPGNNLFAIDGYTTSVPQLAELQSLANWRILVGTRLRLPQWREIVVDELKFDDAKSLFMRMHPQINVTDEELTIFFKAVAYNTLTIALVAKTIFSSLDLTLARVIEYFDKQALDNVELQIDLPDEHGNTLRLLNAINATFDLSKLDQFERYFLLYFAIVALPIEDSQILDLVAIWGKEKEAENKIHFTNAINKLHGKGWIERNGQQLTMHRMLQQAVLYQERKYNNPFIATTLMLSSLIQRLYEGAARDINQALRFLKYGEAVLENIKEEYRGAIYEPMLRLENEVLNIYNWFYTEEDTTVRYESLYNRAKVALTPKFGLLGVIANNYGLTLVVDGEFEKAMILFDEAAEILEAQDDKALPELLTALCNLCHLFIKRGDMARFTEYFSKIKEFRDKHKVWEDVSLPIQSGVLGVANQELRNYERALEMFNLAINLHLELPEEKRNDLQLVGYVIHATECYLATKQVEKAEKAITYASNILARVSSRDSKYFGQIIQLLIVICEIKGENEQAEKLKESLKKMGFSDQD